MVYKLSRRILFLSLISINTLVSLHTAGDSAQSSSPGLWDWMPGVALPSITLPTFSVSEMALQAVNAWVYPNNIYADYRRVVEARRDADIAQWEGQYDSLIGSLEQLAGIHSDLSGKSWMVESVSDAKFFGIDQAERLPKNNIILDADGATVRGPLIEGFSHLIKDLASGVAISDLAGNWRTLSNDRIVLQETYMELLLNAQRNTTPVNALSAYLVDLGKNKTVQDSLIDQALQRRDPRVARLYYHLFDESLKPRLNETIVDADTLESLIANPVSARLAAQPGTYFVQRYQQKEDRKLRDASNALSRPTSRAVLDWLCAQAAPLPADPENPTPLLDAGLAEQLEQQNNTLACAMIQIGNKLRPYLKA